MNHKEIEEIAAQNNLGTVYFQFNVAKNGTHSQFEVGYVTVNGQRELFCKRNSNSNPDQFYLCNQFGALNLKEKVNMTATTTATENREPRITYIRDKNGFPVVCLVYSRTEPGCLTFAYSCHNPQDKFDRKIAKNVAMGRFHKSPSKFYFDVDSASLKNVLHDLMCSWARDTTKDVPSRMRKAAVQYLDYTAHNSR